MEHMDVLEHGGKSYKILFGKKPEAGELVHEFEHNHPSCIGVWEVTKVGNHEFDDYTFFDVNGEEATTYRERLYLIEEIKE